MVEVGICIEVVGPVVLGCSSVRVTERVEGGINNGVPICCGALHSEWIATRYEDVIAINKWSVAVFKPVDKGEGYAAALE